MASAPIVFEILKQLEDCVGTSNLYWVKRRRDAPEKNHQKKTISCHVHDAELCETDEPLFYKETISGVTYDAKKNGHALRDGLAELGLLKQTTNACVVRLAASVDLGLRGIGIVLELAKANFREVYFRNGSLMAVDQLGGAQEHIQLVKEFAAFCLAALEFLASKGIVYCDWKFDNILCFHEGAKARNTRLKLADFGSILNADVPVPNPRNINQMFGSPSFAHRHEIITPTFGDDRTSVRYMLYKLNYVKLPWELYYVFERPTEPTDEELREAVAFTNFLKVYKMIKVANPADLLWWPSHDWFMHT